MTAYLPVPREEIEFTLAMAEKGLRSEAPAEVMAELCRVYLAWLDAPEGTTYEDRDGDNICVLLDEKAIQPGQRVRAVVSP